MPTVIDSLIVEFGLDPRQFKRGSKEIDDSLHRTENEAQRSGKVLEASGKRAGMFFHEMRSQATALFTVLTAGKGLEKFTADTLRQDAATGRLAKTLNLATSDLGEWQRVAVRTGGTAEGITSALAGIQDKYQAIRMFGTTGAVGDAMLRQVGITNPNQLKDSGQALLTISDALSKMDPARGRAVGQALGFDQETISLLERGRPAVQAMLDAEKARGGVSEASAKKSEELNKQLADLKSNFDEAGRELLVGLLPQMTEFLTLLNGALHAAPGVTKALFGLGAAATALASIKLGAGFLRLFAVMFPGSAAAAEAAGGAGAAVAGGAAASVAGAVVGGAALALIPTAANAGEEEQMRARRAAWRAAHPRSVERQTTDFIQAREGFLDHGRWDVNAYRAGYGSDTLTDPTTGKVTRVTSQTKGVTRAMANADLERRLRTEFIPRARAQVGDKWEGLSDAAKVALTSVAYNYGKLPGDIARAAAGGDEAAVAAAIRAHQNDNKGVNKGRRNREADSILKGIRSGSRAGQTGGAGGTSVTATTTIGTIQINTKATDAPGIARTIGPAVRNQNVAVQAQGGLR